MAAGVMNRIVKRLTKAVLSAQGGDIPDGQLLQYFLDRQDEVAFAALVRRHGPMVLGVCRRILGNSHDADDAFQAAFYVLVRKGDTIVPREMVGNWLYGVAYRTAMKARAVLAKRKYKERPVSHMLLNEVPHAEGLDENLWRELQAQLDHELNRLPDKYRVPVVLCDLEGKTRHDVARQLGWTEGTLSGRLARARALLAERLGRRGVALSAATLAVALSGNAATAAMPPTLLNSTVQTATLMATGQLAAAALPGPVSVLMEGVLQAMWWTKLKTAAVILLAVGILGTGLGVASHQAWAYREVLVAPQDQSQVNDDPAVAATQADNADKEDNQKNKKKDGDKKDNEDGQKNNDEKDNKNKNDNNNQKNNKDAKNKNDKDDGQKNSKDAKNKNDKDDKDKNNKNDGDKKKAGDAPTKGKKGDDKGKKPKSGKDEDNKDKKNDDGDKKDKGDKN